MLRTLLALTLLPLVASPMEAKPSQGDVRAQFVALADKKDGEALAKLWREHPHEVLTAIDEDLEGSLATWEKSSDKPDAAAIKAQQERALWGARIASDALKTPIFADYASSFVGWNEAQKKSFRAGQAAFGRARKAAKSGDHAGAAEAGRECADRALPLGDWWGYAMGLSAEGNALVHVGEKERALASLSQARLVFHDLGLIGDEYGCAKALAKLCQELALPARALACAKSASELASLVGDEQGKTELEKLVRDLETAPAKR